MNKQIFENNEKQLKDNGIVTLMEYNDDCFEASAISYSIGMRYKKGSIIPLVNIKNGRSIFNYGQLQLIKSIGGKYDPKTEFWFIS